MNESSLQVAVKVNDADRSIGFIDAPEKRQSDGVIASQSDDPRQSLPSLGNAFLACVGRWSAHQNAIMPFLDLLNRIGIVIPGLVLVEERALSETPAHTR